MSQLDLRPFLANCTDGLCLEPIRTFPFPNAGTLTMYQSVSMEHLTAIFTSGASTARLIWDAGVYLAFYLDTLGSEGLKGKRILELGAGTGLPGLVAARLGADVVITDLPDELNLIRKNVERNSHDILGSVRVESLFWGKSSQSLQSIIERFPPFDLIIGSDLLYSDTHVSLLRETFPLLAKHGSKEYLMSYEERNFFFFDQLVDGFDCHTLPYPWKDTVQLPIFIRRFSVS